MSDFDSVDPIKLATTLVAMESFTPLARRYLSIRAREELLSRSLERQRRNPPERLRCRQNRVVILRRFLEAKLAEIVRIG